MTAAERYRQVASLHSTCIGQGFLATLGTPFLGLMYRAIDAANGSVLLVEERDGRVIGFVAGGCGMGRIYRQMLRRPLRLGWSLLPTLLRPSWLKRIVDILRYGRQQKSNADWPEAELLSIAVASEARGQGVAERLYARLEAHFQDHDVTAFRIVVGEALAPAHRFYQRMGALARDRIEVHPGEFSTLYVQEVPAQGARRESRAADGA